MLTNLGDAKKNHLVREATCTKSVKKVSVFSSGVGGGQAGLQVTTGLNWPFNLSTLSCK